MGKSRWPEQHGARTENRSSPPYNAFYISKLLKQCFMVLNIAGGKRCVPYGQPSSLSSSAHSSLPTSSPLELFTRWTFLVFNKHHTSREQSWTKRTKKHAYRSKQGTRKEIKRETQVTSYFYSMLSQRQRRPLAYKFILQIYSSQHVYKCKYKDFTLNYKTILQDAAYL